MGMGAAHKRRVGLVMHTDVGDEGPLADEKTEILFALIGLPTYLFSAMDEAPDIRMGGFAG